MQFPFIRGLELFFGGLDKFSAEGQRGLGGMPRSQREATTQQAPSCKPEGTHQTIPGLNWMGPVPKTTSWCRGKASMSFTELGFINPKFAASKDIWGVNPPTWPVNYLSHTQSAVNYQNSPLQKCCTPSFSAYKKYSNPWVLPHKQWVVVVGRQREKFHNLWTFHENVCWTCRLQVTLNWLLRKITWYVICKELLRYFFAKIIICIFS